MILNGARGVAPPTGRRATLLTEKQALLAAARQWTFAAGTVLCRQDQPVDHVIVIRSGWIRVYSEDGGVMRFMTERGPGDIVGERAALLVRSRSATVVAVTKVRSMVVTTDNFALLDAHPRVLEVLERLIYHGLTEGRSDSANFSRPAGGQGARRGPHRGLAWRRSPARAGNTDEGVAGEGVHG